MLRVFQIFRLKNSPRAFLRRFFMSLYHHPLWSQSCPDIQSLRRLRLPLFRSDYFVSCSCIHSHHCIFKHSVSAPLFLHHLLVSWSRSSSILEKFHLMPFLYLSVLRIVQSTVNRKRKPDTTHPCLTPVALLLPIICRSNLKKKSQFLNLNKVQRSGIPFLLQSLNCEVFPILRKKLLEFLVK